MIISKLRPLLRPKTVLSKCKRDAGHGMMTVEPTMWTELFAYDKIHFYCCLGLGPLLLFGTYMSVFYGDAVLQDTPEGYEPEDWECERNPVQRLLARYYLPDSVFKHEYKVGLLAREADSRMVNLAIREVKRVQQQHRDYQAWYFQPTERAVQNRIERYKSDKEKHYQNLPRPT